MTRTVPGPSGEGYEIGLAEIADLEVLPSLERRAAAIFPEGLLPKGAPDRALPRAVTREAQLENRIFVARGARSGRVVGFALVAEADGHGHLEELDVDPRFGRQGIGRRLVERACDWAAAQGYLQISLSTFREVPWNAPFYARLGFVEKDPATLGPDLARRRAGEEQSGFDLSDRCLMVRAIGSA